MKRTFIGIVTIIAVVVLCFMFNKALGIAAIAAAVLFAVYSYIPIYFASKGNAAFAAGDDKAALQWYEKAVNTNRANLIIRISYAFVLLRNGLPDKAEAVLNEILMNKYLPEDKKNTAKQYRCMVYYKQGRLDEAVEDAEELFEYYKNTAMYGMLGYFKILIGEDADKVLEFCLEAYDFNDNDRDILDNLSIAYYNKGEYDKAREISDKLIESAPKFIEAFYHGAKILDKCGQPEKALELLANVENCTRSYLTTVSEQDIEEFKKELENKIK